jgi:hypothetical protein
MKTTHQVARELLALPDVELVIEGWCDMSFLGYTMKAEMTAYDRKGTAIIWQKPPKQVKARRINQASSTPEHTQI